ncbi:general transcription factor IIF subunit 1-like isoform X2 [Takifugu rubripes]|uniref:Transcription initiation factor IIF subunit alpha n=2 Tax=Takifugu TaxID=31032 RepID=A0A674P0L2_TAKRU|nr:general transcription factor IIF subunit 1-like isoform X2 [Takifugu rubripes]XP_056871254.1 general transcription factor IIF subunit 1-like isoform X2 [Takifugu flavidus]TWW69846.1 IIF subunit 1 Transcription initiation factor [Takifugu flavidus]|eukprot:XP_011602148.1 PREDICTED: general transcription factor IIF subunit 1-like [Takifugu rubripes]
MTSLGNSSSSVTEYTVRVPKNTGKKYNIMAFNVGDKVNCSTWTQARMERDLSARRIYGEEEAPESGAGSEFGKKQREESRRKKFGIVTREFKAEDQPWILKVNGKGGRRFKGQRKGGVTENASYYIFTQCADGVFEAFPVNSWYNFTPISKHRTLTAEEAEEEWSRRNKVVNHFSIMLQRRLREDQGEDEEEESEKSGKKKKGGRKGGDLRIHDLEEELEMSSEDSDWSAGEEGENKKPKKTSVKGKGKKKKRKDDSEALEDSDDGDYEGLEVDYMSDESSSEEEPEKGKPNKGEDVPKGIDEASESEEESEEEKQNSEEAKEEEEEEEGKKTPVQLEKKKKKDSSGESDSSDDSDIEGEATSALFMKKRTPPKRGGGRGSAGSSRTGSRPGTPSIDSASTSNTLRAAASKLEQGKRQAPGPDCPAAKRLKMEPSSQSPGPSGKSTPQPPSGKSTPSSSDIQLTEDAVRRYLIRKPMTTKDLLKKFQTKRTGLSSEQTVNVLAQILKRLNPERKNVNDKMHFYLME